MQTILNTFNRFVEMIFPWQKNSNSKERAKSRLKLIIAHDRASINPDMLKAMREEILDVVARYVEVDREEMEFSLSNDQRITALTANLPIRQVKRLSELKQELQETNDVEIQTIELVEADGDTDKVN